MADGDAAFADFLHDQGYPSGYKKFKFFNFSALDIRPYKLHKERGVFELLGSKASLVFGCVLPDIATPLIKGLFRNASGTIGDRINKINFRVEEIQLLSPPAYRPTMQYEVKTLCVITRPPQNGERYGQYLFPDHEDYASYLIENLRVKYETACNVLVYDSDDDIPDIRIEHDSTYRNKKIKIKPFTPQETDVKGSLFHCSITAPQEVHQLIWDMGLGEKNSMGCGWVRVNSR